ncbi:MAG: amidohydrolase [Novosphingobium sp.]|nr:amidohydrolase [Novosphingobium sp.]
MTAGSLPVAAAPAATADLVLINGKVITVDKAFAVKSAVAVKDGRIVAVGGKEIGRKWKAARTIDLKGRTLMPGFIDAHLHLKGVSHRSIEPDKARSITELGAMVAAKARELGPGEWVAGSGWDEALLAEKRNPTRADLDAIAPDNPVVLVRAGAHSAVGNSLALKLAGIDAATPDPDGGLIERGADGVPNGMIRERTDLLLRLVPADSAEQMRPSYVRALKDLLALGITSFMEAWTTIDDEPVERGGLAGGGGNAVRGHTFRQLRTIYDQQGEDLPRATLYIMYPGAERLKKFPHHTGFGDDRLKLGPIGESAYDGGFTGPTARTSKDYKGQPGFRGTTFMTEHALQEMVDTSARLGWQLGIHAIGDEAIDTVASAYHRTLSARPKADHRWFLSHFTMLPTEQTMRTMAADGIWTTAQPNFTYNLEGRYLQVLDGERLDRINPVATPISYGVNVVMSSDNLPIGPMVGLYAAVTRKGMAGHQFAKAEAITREEAIRLYTAKAAALTWDEARKGSIEPGKFADFIVLDRDPLTVPAEQLLQTRVDLTFVGGKLVWDRQAN